jgi:hypothetical protein
MKKIGTLILFAAIVFLNTSCNNASMVAKVTLEGYAYDSLGGKPVNGLWVYLYACEYDGKDDAQCQPYLVGQAQTDISGRFYLRDDAARSNRYSLVINGHGMGEFNFGVDNSWLKANCAKIYLNKL